MDFSIIICTFNRAHNLADCFSRLEQQEDVETISWEVIVVDNNSTDNTRPLVEEYATSSPLALRYAFEPEQGLSAARNHGIDVARGTHIIFIDDDIRVSKRWLKSIYDTFKENDCDAVGGRIEVESPSSLPAWIRPDMYGFLGHQDFGDKPKLLNGVNEFPFGGNMAIHRRVVERIGLFDTGLGRKGEGKKQDELFKGEETDFFHRLARDGGRLCYQPEALVRHIILPHQLTKAFFLTLHRNAGLLYAQRDKASYGHTLFGVPPFVLRQYLKAIREYWLQRLRQGADLAFRQRMNIWYFRGMITGYHKSNAVNQ